MFSCSGYSKSSCKNVRMEKYMNQKTKTMACIGAFFLFFSFSLSAYETQFVNNERMLLPFYDNPNVVMVASSGRSGSTMLTNCLTQFSAKCQILKTHILPPKNRFRGKIIFIFSNPDEAAESALHLTIRNKGWGREHFYHMASSDLKWLQKLVETTNQTVEDNLLSYDALGCYQHLVEWLYNTEPSESSKAQILAIKYENLWDLETVQAIKSFLKLDKFELPAKRERGYSSQELNPKELQFREIYNLGTEEVPIYRAYDHAREIWKNALPITYLELP